ncbi:MAG TPA: helicase-related protein [Solirubrobacterales bacterium]|nr:helicase-related protein [Solirubrobacterales bacterium]
MNQIDLDTLVGRRIRLAGHFPQPVQLDDLRRKDGGVELRVVTPQGDLDRTLLRDDELDQIEVVEERVELVDGDDFFDFVEAHRIELAYAHDPNFAVSMSGVRGLPHQIEAVYRRMLPQARLRFVLADDPGAGKTIMAGLLMKELQLRSVADRILVLCPAPLTPQWQAELAEKFDEDFEIFDSRRVKWQPGGNPWQQSDRVIASLDFAKRDEIIPDLSRAEWDLLVIDEAHKCAAASRWDPEEERDRLDATRRYQLARQLSARSERLLLMTATPHSGDKSRFQNFLKLLDPDQFALPDLAASQIARENSPYFLRRQKEDLKDEHGNDLFVPREVLRQPFVLTPPELRLYDSVTSYIQEFLGNIPGKRGTAVALARTVLQCRLASSLGAIRSSLRKRADRISARIDEVADLPPSEQRKRLAEMRMIDELDTEQESDDTTEEEQEEAASGVVVAETLDHMRAEVLALEGLVALADETIEQGQEAKLTALKECLSKSELQELDDGRGKLLIFTEHRDTLDYLLRHLSEWGYSTCAIHGGMPPTERRKIQQEFHESKQICVATEAAGEGINLQFCHLMINYDLPWNPVRLEQRMGRIHRIGQEATCYIFNFCAENTIEGKLLGRLLEKLDEMREALHGRVYDVVGEVLERNGVDFERLLRESLLSPERIEASEQEINAIDPEVYRRYQEDVGVAQATKHVDMSWVRDRDWRSEERRLMPEYVEGFFGRACGQVGVRIEQRADGLWRIENVPQTVRAERLDAVKRLGRPHDSYRKLTFRKEIRTRAEHEDAVLVSPGHPLYASVAEVMLEKLEPSRGGIAPFVAPWATEAFPIHFFTFTVRGFDTHGEPENAYGELVAVTDEGGELSVIGADVLHDLTPVGVVPGEEGLPDSADIARAEDFVKVHVQHTEVQRTREERLGQAELRREYLVESMKAQRERLEMKWTELDDRVYRGEETVTLARDQAQRKIDELDRRLKEKLAGFDNLGIAKPGPVGYLGSALVLPPPASDDPGVEAMRNDPEVERAAMGWAMEAERAEGWDPTDVSQLRDGRGFDIRSVRRDEAGREVEVRRIEVKGRGPRKGDVSLCNTEWIAAHRHGDSYWLYVLYGAKSETPRGFKVRNPAKALGQRVRKVTTITAFHIPGEAIEEAGT